MLDTFDENLISETPVERKSKYISCRFYTKCKGHFCYIHVELIHHEPLRK